MTSPQPEEHLGQQEERTLLAWRRTALSLVAAGALVAHLARGGFAVAVVLAGLGAVIVFVWLIPGRRVAAAGLALVVGVLLLGALALPVLLDAG